MAKDSETIGDRLAQARKRLGMSQAALCEATGVALGSLKKWEGGDSIPGGEALQKLATAGIDLNWLVTGVRYSSDDTGRVLYPLPPPMPSLDGLSPDEQLRILEQRSADIKAMLAVHGGVAAPAPPAPAPAPLKINIEALGIMLQAVEMAHPNAPPARKAALAAEFYALSVAQGHVSADEIIPTAVKDAA